MATAAQAIAAIGAGIGGIFAVAIVSVIVSQRSASPAVIGAGGTALSQIIGAAVAPVSSGQAATLPAAPQLATAQVMPLTGATNPLGGLGSVLNGTSAGGFNSSSLQTAIGGFPSAGTDTSAADPLNQDFSSADFSSSPGGSFDPANFGFSAAAGG